jgi:hypothetical protein
MRWLMVVVALFSSSLWAADLFFDIHDQARVLYVTEKRLENYTLALGTYRKTRNRWHPEESLHLAGKLKSRTLELSENYDAAEVFEFYRRQLLPQKTSVLFFCESRDCGSSNAWANNHFNIRQLYGLDQFQFYGVYQWRLEPDSPIHYITLYTVRRGNGRVCAQIDVFLPDDMGGPATPAN